MLSVLVTFLYALHAAGEEAVLCYSRLPGGSLDLYHTEVPPSQRGQGLGAVLAKVGGVKWSCDSAYLANQFY